MLFNSYIFLGVFLPGALLLILIVQQTRNSQVLFASVITLSTIFYCYSSFEFFLLLLFPVTTNYLLAAALPSRGVLTLGIAFNLLLLGVFKYAGFFSAELNKAGFPSRW